MASEGACGSRCTAWTSNRPAWRSAFRSSRATSLSRIMGAEAKIVAQVLHRGDAERLSRALDEGALRVLLVGSRQSEDVGRNDALGQVVDALETAAPGRCRDMTSPKEPLEGLLGV